MELTERLGFDADHRKARAAQFGLGASSQALTDLLHAEVIGPSHDHLHQVLFRAVQEQPAFTKLVTDASVFPSCIRVNAQWTTMAMAHYATGRGDPFW